MVVCSDIPIMHRYTGVNYSVTADPYPVGPPCQDSVQGRVLWRAAGEAIVLRQGPRVISLLHTHQRGRGPQPYGLLQLELQENAIVTKLFHNALYT